MKIFYCVVLILTTTQLIQAQIPIEFGGPNIQDNWSYRFIFGLTDEGFTDPNKFQSETKQSIIDNGALSTVQLLSLERLIEFGKAVLINEEIDQIMSWIKSTQKKELYYLKGKCFHHLNKLDSAEIYYTNSALVDREFVLPYGALAEIFIENGRTEAQQMASLYATKLTNKEEDFFYWYLAGILVQKMNGDKKEDDFTYSWERQNQKAIDYLQKSVNIQKGFAKAEWALSRAYLTVNPDESYTYFYAAKKSGYKISNQDESDFYVQIAQSFYDNKAYNKALNYYLSLYEQQKNNTGLINRIAECYSNLEIYLKAEEFYLKLLTLEPSDVNKCALAINTKRLGKTEEAIKLFAEIKPKIITGESYSNREYCSANCELADIYIKKGDKLKAQFHLKLARNYIGFSTDQIHYYYNKLVTDCNSL